MTTFTPEEIKRVNSLTKESLEKQGYKVATDHARDGYEDPAVDYTEEQLEQRKHDEEKSMEVIMMRRSYKTTDYEANHADEMRDHLLDNQLA